MTDLSLRLNVQTQDIEIIANNKVVDTVGAEVVASWVEALNEKNGVNKTPEVEETPVEPPAEAPAPEAPVEKETPTEPPVDDKKEE